MKVGDKVRILKNKKVAEVFFVSKNARIVFLIINKQNSSQVLQDVYRFEDVEVLNKTSPIETFSYTMINNAECSIFYYCLNSMIPNCKPISVLSDWEEWERNLSKNKNIAGIQRNFIIK